MGRAEPIVNKEIKIDNNKISKPFVVNENLFLATDNSIIRLD